MAAVDLWRRGSKRRIARIRWKRWEIVHVAILILLMIAFGIWIGLWIGTHHFD
jgi:hypothetical protein